MLRSAPFLRRPTLSTRVLLRQWGRSRPIAAVRGLATQGTPSETPKTKKDAKREAAEKLKELGQEQQEALAEMELLRLLEDEPESVMGEVDDWQSVSSMLEFQNGPAEDFSQVPLGEAGVEDAAEVARKILEEKKIPTEALKGAASSKSKSKKKAKKKQEEEGDGVEGAEGADVAGARKGGKAKKAKKAKKGKEKEKEKEKGKKKKGKAKGKEAEAGETDEKSGAKGSKSKKKLDSDDIEVHSIQASSLNFAALDNGGLKVPRLSYGLDRCLFKPGVYPLQDQRSKVYNFDPYLSSIMPVDKFDFGALKAFVSSSEDPTLIALARENQKKYSGSTSSMSNMLSHFHFLVSAWRPITADHMSRGFTPDNMNFTRITRAPAATFLRYKDGVYAIDSDKQFDSGNILSMLGKSLEKLLTLPRDEYEKYSREQSHLVTDEMKQKDMDSFHFTGQGDFILRSQLDAHDSRLPGSGMYDIKTRAVLTIRMDAKGYQKGLGYEIRQRFGQFESFEREYFDMIRSAFLKYSLQVRMGRMDGIFVAFHNTRRMFGFQYIPLEELDMALHGTTTTDLGDQEFRISLHLLNELLNRATTRFPGQSLRIHIDARPTNPPILYFFAKPVDDDKVSAAQAASRVQAEKFEREMMGVAAQQAQAEEEGEDEEDAPSETFGSELSQYSEGLNISVWTEMNRKVEEAVESDELGVEYVRDNIEEALEQSGLLEGKSRDEIEDWVDKFLETLIDQGGDKAADKAALAEEQDEEDEEDEVEDEAEEERRDELVEDTREDDAKGDELARESQEGEAVEDQLSQEAKEEEAVQDNIAEEPKDEEIEQGSEEDELAKEPQEEEVMDDKLAEESKEEEELMQDEMAEESKEEPVMEEERGEEKTGDELEPETKEEDILESDEEVIEPVQEGEPGESGGRDEGSDQLSETDTTSRTTPEETEKANPTIKDLLLRVAGQVEDRPSILTPEAEEELEGTQAEKPSKLQKFERVLGQLLAESRGDREPRGAEDDEYDEDGIRPASSARTKRAGGGAVLADVDNLLDSMDVEGDASGELLGMILTVRNKVDGKYVNRPMFNDSKTRWQVEYSIQTMDGARADTLYKQVKARRQRVLSDAMKSGDGWHMMFGAALPRLSSAGQRYRKKLDQDMKGKPVWVYGEENAREWAEVFGAADEKKTKEKTGYDE